MFDMVMQGYYVWNSATAHHEKGMHKSGMLYDHIKHHMDARGRQRSDQHVWVHRCSHYCGKPLLDCQLVTTAHNMERHSQRIIPSADLSL